MEVIQVRSGHLLSIRYVWSTSRHKKPHVLGGVVRRAQERDQNAAALYSNVSPAVMVAELAVHEIDPAAVAVGAT